MTGRITRHFVSVGSRRVHYTRAGEGPAVVLLHESPCSAKSLAIPQSVLAEQFTAIAPDTPGFGLSDPLPLDKPEIADFADALAETLTALGIRQAAVYGRHTGASIAVEFARRHPEQCTMAVADGYPVYSGPQRESRLTDYLKPIVPSWEGAHLLWLWFRYREQHVFWPWHAQTAAHRADQDVPDLGFLHRGVVEFLEAGDGYRLAYAAAFRHGGQGLSVLPDLHVPVCFAARQGDSLFRTLSLFPSDSWTAALDQDEAVAARETMALLARHPAPAAPAAEPCAPLPGRTTTSYIDLGGAQLLLRSAGEAHGGIPMLVLHDVPGSSALLDPLLLRLGEQRRVLAFDLLGQGESIAPDDWTPSVGVWAESLLTALDRLGIARVHIYGHGSGGVIGAVLASRAPDRVASLHLGAPPALPAEGRALFAAGYAPSAQPESDGSHLLRVWHHLRDQELWWPWHERTRAAARSGEPEIDPQTLTRRARECLKQPMHYQASWQTVLSYGLRELLLTLHCRSTVTAGERDLFAPLAGDAAGCLGVQAVSVPMDWSGRGTAILAHLPQA